LVGGGSGCLARRARTEGSSRRVGEWLCTGSGAEFRAFFYRLRVPQFADGGGQTVSSGVRKGGQEGGACSLRGGTTG